MARAPEADARAVLAAKLIVFYETATQPQTARHTHTHREQSHAAIEKTSQLDLGAGNCCGRTTRLQSCDAIVLKGGTLGSYENMFFQVKV